MDERRDRAVRERLQAHVDDVVLEAAVFQPNARGRFEVSSVRGLSERQVLKGSARYVAERVIVGVTSLEVCVVPTLLGRPIWRAMRRWPRSEVIGHGVVSAGLDLRDRTTAVRLDDRGGGPIVELRPSSAAPAADAVVDLLLGNAVLV